MSELANILSIRTVACGFYQGFNPVVLMVAKALVVALVITLVAFPIASGVGLEALKGATLEYFGAWYIYLLATFVLFCFGLLLLPISGRIKFGADGDVPNHSTASWLAMMFCSGIGVGILVFSVSEPISHFSSNPHIISGQIEANSNESLNAALQYVFLHWGVSAWACYAIIGMALGLSCHRLGQPMTMRSAVAPLLGKYLEGAVGHLIDVISILAIIAGITTTIVLGLEQICSGLSALTGSPFFADQLGTPPLTALLAALVVAIAIALASILSGLDRGVKWVSAFGIFLALAVLAVFAFSGPGGVFSGALGAAFKGYVVNLPSMLFATYNAPEDILSGLRNWQSEWTIFYWAWWIAFAPFVGLFLARISRGCTLREFILGAVLGPTAMCFLWFSVLGGSAIMMELNGTAEGRIIDAPHAFRIYETIDLAVGPYFQVAMKAVVALLMLVLIVASSTAAIIAIKSIGAAGGTLSEAPKHSLVWAVVIASVTGAVMAVGGVEFIRDVMIVGAVPFSIIMALMLVSIARVIFDDWRSGFRI